MRKKRSADAARKQQQHHEAREKQPASQAQAKTGGSGEASDKNGYVERHWSRGLAADRGRGRLLHDCCRVVGSGSARVAKQ